MSKYIIVGGVAGGATTAARLRRLDEKAEIIMYERGEHVSFANCGLPYYIGGTITDRENLFVMTPEKFKKRLNVDVKNNTEVLSINTENKTVETINLLTNKKHTDNYDKLVLSPGADPFVPPIPGIDNPRIFTLRNVPDTDKIKDYIDNKQPKRAIIVGAGFIGLEMAENLHQRGIYVTIVEMAEQVMAPIDFEMAAEVHQHLKTKHVEFYLKDSVISFSTHGETITARLKSGRELKTDMVILSIGVRPESSLAKNANLDLTDRGAIIVNEYLQTSNPDIYAVGDAIAFENPITGKKMNTLLAGPANRQGRICADNIVNGNVRKYKGSINTSVAKVFDITVASTGMAEKFLKNEGIKYCSNIIHSGNHAGYYPGAIPMTLKIVFSPEDGKVLGAQAIGYEGVDKRIDIIATIIGKNGNIYDLQEVEHAYAPPYSSAKDPVNISGYAAENILKNMVKIIKWDELINENRSDLYLLDVRTPEEFELGTIEGSINIPVDDLRSRIKEVPKNKKVIVFCAVGLRGYLAYRILNQNGFENIYNLSGGYTTYKHTIAPQGNEDIFSDDKIDKDDIIYTYKKKSDFEENISLNIDACGMQCPGPIMKLKKESDKIKNGSKLLITATDPGFAKDVNSWCNITGNKLELLDQKAGVITAIITKGNGDIKSCKTGIQGGNKTIVVFSDDFDRSLACFVIANGAVSMGKKVTMFFTFWGLNLLKKRKPSKKVKKDFLGKMFGMMLPKGSKDLSLSKMNMMGMGTFMMRKIMKSKKIDSLEDMIKSAADAGIKMLACQMSMDVMGVKKEELFDFVEVAGVATYLEASEDSNLNLFI